MRVAMVFTRTVVEETGRAKSIRATQAVLNESFDVEVFNLRSFLETRRLADVVRALVTWTSSLLLLRPMALQCVLFVTSSNCDMVIANISNGGFDAVYIDMVRSEYFLRKLRQALPSIRIVTDLDDLISRRMRLWAEAGLPISMGFMTRFIPTYLRRASEKLLPSRLIQRYEFFGLVRAEREMTEASDAVVLCSAVESELLRLDLPDGAARKIRTINQAAEIRRLASRSWRASRFIFVGSDSYQPNRIAIDVLLDQWLTLRPAFELHIYGRQKRLPIQVPGVRWHGFVEDISEAYEVGSIALAPLPFPGGIKTKVVEAWSFGCPVLGTPEALEGLCGEEYALSLALAEWSEYLIAPAAKQALWYAAAHMGQMIVRDRMSLKGFREAWRAIFLANKPHDAA
jgi:glycosyltransferase involved in cell wall biosynthesis